MGRHRLTGRCCSGEEGRELDGWVESRFGLSESRYPGNGILGLVQKGDGDDLGGVRRGEVSQSLELEQRGSDTHLFAACPKLSPDWRFRKE